MIRKFTYFIDKKIRRKRNFDKRKDIKKEELEFFKKEGAILIDVRSPQEFREGHLKGAISIPYYQIKREIEKRRIDKNAIIVLYCSTGHRSIKGQQILESMGYVNVYNLFEGIE